MTFTDINPGDELWIINGRGTSVYEADVHSVTEHTIGVKAKSKSTDEVLLFARDTGKSLAEHSEAELARDEDWRVKVILDRKEHTRRHQAVMKAVKAFYEDPTAENGFVLNDAVHDWRFVVVSADPVAIVSESWIAYAAAHEVHA